MRLSNLVIPVLIVLSLASCGSGVPAPGTPQAFASVCDKPNEGQTVAVEGYLRLPAVLDDSHSVMLRLFPDPDFSGKPIGVSIHFGNGPNQAERIVSSYRDEDLKVRLADGRQVPFRTRVRVSGRVYFPVVPQRFDCALENPYIEAAK